LLDNGRIFLSNNDGNKYIHNYSKILSGNKFIEIYEILQLNVLLSKKTKKIKQSTQITHK